MLPLPELKKQLPIPGPRKSRSTLTRNVIREREKGVEKSFDSLENKEYIYGYNSLMRKRPFTSGSKGCFDFHRDWVGVQSTLVDNRKEYARH